jgi:cytochrome c peroxidase
MRRIALLFALAGCAPAEPEVGTTTLDDDARDALDGVLDLPSPLYAYDLPPPAHAEAAARAFDNTPADNPITDAGATLGRVLFWDTALSASGTVACASCHLPDAGFADVTPGSLGHAGGLTPRKSMPLVNVRYYAPGRMFWDERADTLEDQVLAPIQDPVEMGLTLDELVARVEGSVWADPLFEAAFGDPAVDEARIADALAQFVRSMTSFDSAWDAAIAEGGDPRAPLAGLTAEENRGKDIFFGRVDGVTGPLCAGCHLAALTPPGAPPGGPANFALFQAPGPRVNGLPDPDDAGLFDVTGRAADRGRFKTPSLRNVALRAPYMHDGRFETLDEVVAFYDRGVADAPNLDPLLRGADGGPIRLNLSPADRAALVAFLETLTDEGPATAPRWSDPFVR